MADKLSNYTIDELNDFSARLFPKLNIQHKWKKGRIISTIRKYVKDNKIDIDAMIEKEIEFETMIPELVSEDVEVYSQPVYKPIKCHRCNGKMVLVDNVNNDYKCPNCGARTTVMRK